MERARIRLLALATMCGVVMVLLSFSSWVRFNTIDYSDETGVVAVNPVSFEINGYETSRFRDRENLLAGDVLEEEEWCSCRVGFGDGYITAALGAIVGVSAVIALATSRDRPFAMGMVGASVGTIFLAGYNALGEWQAITWTQLGQTEFVDGNTEPGLWALVVVSAIGALIGAGIWTLARAEEEDEWDDEEYEDDLYENEPQQIDPQDHGYVRARVKAWA